MARRESWEMLDSKRLMAALNRDHIFRPVFVLEDESIMLDDSPTQLKKNGLVLG